MDSSFASTDSSNDIEAIKTDLAALRVAIDLVRAQYEERMTAIRDAHQSILAEATDGGKQAETEELSDEVRRMEVKMALLESQAGGLESALDRYTALFLEELKLRKGDTSEVKP